tara:strand:+ start:20699 stop:21712 length:1014 start_codon:yes stop_codon:yes gene_type:complete
MHRVVILTDLHLRSDYMPGYLETQLSTLRELVNREPPDSVVINGDIFHRRNPKGEELLAFRKLLESLDTNKIYVNRGNHDTVKKDGSSDTTLSLYGDIAHIISEYEQIDLGGVTFDFIPHFEDESHIIKCLKKTQNPMFGHFGFDGCVSHGHYSYESDVKQHHFGDRLVFLGHIHSPQRYDDNILVLGTQYSTSFGEPNSQKYLHELLIENGEVEIVREPINFGIRHIVCSVSSLEKASTKYDFESFFIILRLKLDKLDEGCERELADEILAKYHVNHLEIAFSDVLPKYDSSHVDYESILRIDDKVIEEYIDNATTIFSKKELLRALDDIKTYENK